MQKAVRLALLCLLLVIIVSGYGKRGSAIAGSGDSGQTRLTSTADLKDKRIAVMLGTAQETFATATYPNATILKYNSFPDMVVAVKSGKADAMLYDSESLQVLLRQDDQLALLEGGSLVSFPIGAGFNRNNVRLRDAFDRFLRRIRQNGVYNDMVERWMKKGETRMPDIPVAAAGDELVVGIDYDGGFPFSAIKDNEVTGFDVEFAKRFAAFLGKRAKLADMEFGALIAAVSTNKIDVIISGMFITDERKKRIIFSDPYYETGTMAVALRKNGAAAADVAGTGTGKAIPSFLKGIGDSFRSNIVQENRYLLIWDGLKTTVAISVLSTLLGTLLGGVVCALRMSNSALLNRPAAVYIAILRGTPVLVLLMLIFYVVFASVSIDPVIVAVIAFGLNFAAYAAEIFRTGIEGVDKGQSEAGIAMGFTRVSTFIHIILPQTMRRILPVYKGEFISLVKMTSIVGYIAVQDLTKASDIIRSRTFDAFFPLIMVAILYFLISWFLMQSLEYLEARTNPKYRRRKAHIA